jgi:hypothetical protein
VIVGAIVRETILLRRAIDCAHEWHPTTTIGSEACARCGVVAT